MKVKECETSLASWDLPHPCSDVSPMRVNGYYWRCLRKDYSGPTNGDPLQVQPALGNLLLNSMSSLTLQLDSDSEVAYKSNSNFSNEGKGGLSLNLPNGFTA
jgi:hypothetical protein